MAPLVPVVVPLTLNARNTFLRDEAKHPANDSCPTNSLVSSKPNASAKQFVVPQQPVQEKMNITSSESNEDHTIDGDSNSALLLMTDDRDLNGRRKVQWNDSHGKELASVWKFQPRQAFFTLTSLYLPLSMEGLQLAKIQNLANDLYNLAFA